MTGGKRKRNDNASTVDDENENPNEELNSKVENLQENVEKILDKTEKMENQQKLILEKLENLEKSKDSEAEKKPSFNSVIFPGSLMKNTSSSAKPVGRSFVLKHVFEDVSKMEEGKRYHSEQEEHFGVSWNMYIFKKNDNLNFFLKCNNSLKTEKWAIDTNFTVKMIGANGNTTSGDLDYVYEKETGFGKFEFITLEEARKNLFIDDKLTAEIYVNINKMTGIYKMNLRSFDESTKEVSDMILVVGEQKFYVLKLYLAAHSPYFKALFLGQFQESTKSEIKLTGIESEDFQNFLEVLYGDPSIDEFTVEGILLIADMYDTPIAVGKCEAFLMKESNKSNKKKLQMAIRYKLDKLKRKCLSEIKTVADIKSMISGTIKDLDPSIMAELFERSISLQ